ncbi:hypothetical protein ACX0G9_13110 [Flavitalea flava]
MTNLSLRKSCIFFFLLSLVFLFMFPSCKKSGIDGSYYPNPYPVDSINTRYLLYNDGSVNGTSGPAWTIFTYKGGRIVTREGAFVSIGPSSGYPLPFYWYFVYDTVIYQGNKITILTKSRDDSYNPSPNQRDFIIENGRIKQLITARDTINYFYTNNRITRTEDYSKGYIGTRTFLFDNKGNLTEMSRKNVARWDGSSAGYATMNFSGFDASDNPLKGFGLWEDLYYRSVSNNNFSTFEYTDGSLYSRITMNLFYDSKGKVDYKVK